MNKEKGFTGIDIIISIFVFTIFIAIIGNLIVLTNLNNKNIEKNSSAIILAIQEIEKIKTLGYQEEYERKGITTKEILVDEDIYENGKFTGYQKSIYIEDYVFIKQDTEKEPDIVKQITVQISYGLGSGKKVVQLSTCIVKE